MKITIISTGNFPLSSPAWIDKTPCIKLQLRTDNGFISQQYPLLGYVFRNEIINKSEGTSFKQCPISKIWYAIDANRRRIICPVKTEKLHSRFIQLLSACGVSVGLDVKLVDLVGLEFDGELVNGKAVIPLSTQS